MSLCNSFNASYTRYADDISISSNNYFQEKDTIKSILLKYGFSLNELKSQRFKKGQNQYVTGLSISDNLHPRIPKHIKHKIRQHLHYIELYGYHSHICHIYGYDQSVNESITSEMARKLRNYIKGWIDYINPIEPTLAQKFYEKYNLIESTRKKKQVQEINSSLNSGDIIQI